MEVNDNAMNKKNLLRNDRCCRFFLELNQQQTIPFHTRRMNNISIDIDDYNSIPEIECIEMPCFCSSPSKAQDILGGAALVSRILQNETSVIHARISDDPLRQPLVGYRRSCQGILLKLKRNRNGEMQSEVLGRVNSSYKFTTPADYQVPST
jgi:hypothetical protein